MEIYKDENYAWEEHELESGYQDYKNPKISSFLRGYPAGEKIRLGILFFDKTGRPFFVRHLINDSFSPDDFTTPKRNISGNHLLKHHYPYTNGSGESVYYQHNGNVISLLISNLDITDIKDKIGGFSIVRTEIVHTRIGSALLSPVHKDGSDLRVSSRITIAGETDRQKNTYVGYSPERLFDLKGFSINPGDKLENAMYLKPYRTLATDGDGRDYGFTIFSNIVLRYQKCYEERNLSAPLHVNGQLNVAHEILYETKYEVAEDEVVVDPRNENLLFRELSGIAPYTPIPKRGKVSNCSIFITKEEEDINGYKGKFSAAEDGIFLLCDIKRENENPYGGLGDASLANSIYITCGHYQEVNEEVLSDIEENNRWIFDEIQIFGGDTFVNLFSINRLLLDEDISNQMSHSIIYPCESRINIALRGGDFVSKNFPYNATYATLGIRYKTNFHKWEQFNYNDGYSSDDIRDFYLPIPYNWNGEGFRPARIRYSAEKSYGETRDSFRVFPVLQFIDLEINNGEITNIHERFSKLIYWQRNTIGYIPINERALTQNPFGQPIQLGVGGIFERHDDVINKIGNLNQFGLIESDLGFHWFDSVRRILVTLTDSLQLTENSVLQGFDNYANGIPDMSSLDNPLFGYGIIGGYDQKNKMVFITYHLPDNTYKTIGIDLKLNVFMGEYDFPARNYLSIQNVLLGVKSDSKQVIYKHTDSTSFGNYYGEEKESKFSLVFVAENVDPSVYDNLEITGNENFPTKISYDSYDKQVVEQVMRYVPQKEILTRNWGYRNNKWYGNIPFYERQRLVNDYIKISFIFDSGFSFEQFITLVKLIYRKAL